MAQRRGPGENDGPGDEGWIFTPADPGTLPTDRLPGAEDLERLVRMGREDAEPVLAPRPAEAEPPARPAPPEASTYARSGTTPQDDDVVVRGIELPARFAALSWWDAVRDVLALICLTSASTTQLTAADPGPWILAPRLAIAVAVLALLVVHALRWVPRTPPLRVIRWVRILGQVPAVLTALAVLLADLVTAIPVLFSPLPDGPPVGVGAGTALLLVGALVAIEPRAHEGFVPGPRARDRTRRALLGILALATAGFVLSLVMEVGRVLTTGWPFSLRALASSLVSALLLGVVISSGLRREASRYVFSVAAVAGLVLGAVCDSTLRLQFAHAQSAATGFVYLPLLFAAFAVMISRSFVRSMPLTFRRSDWIVYAVRAFDLSVLMHAGAVLWCVLAAIAAAGGLGPDGPGLFILDAVLAGLFAVASASARRALLERPADTARAVAVVLGVAMIVVGFLDVIVNSLVTGAGAGLVTGGVALAVGIAASLMLTVPAPVRDQYGAPDLARMYEDFRRRNAARLTRGSDAPRASERERPVRTVFPGR